MIKKFRVYNQKSTHFLSKIESINLICKTEKDEFKRGELQEKVLFSQQMS